MRRRLHLRDAEGAFRLIGLGLDVPIRSIRTSVKPFQEASFVTKPRVFQMIRYGRRRFQGAGPIPGAMTARSSRLCGCFLNSMRPKVFTSPGGRGCLQRSGVLPTAGDTSAAGLANIINESSGASKAELYLCATCIMPRDGMLAGLAFAGVNLLTRGRWPASALSPRSRGMMRSTALTARPFPQMFSWRFDVRPNRGMLWRRFCVYVASYQRHTQAPARLGPPSHLLFIRSCDRICGQETVTLHSLAASVYEIGQDDRPRLRQRLDGVPARRATSWTDAVSRGCRPRWWGPQYNGCNGNPKPRIQMAFMTLTIHGHSTS